MSHPASRMLAMLELLQAHHALTGANLAARLEVDERTVRRYAAALGELGIPVTAARGRYGGYRLTPGYKLPPLMLTDDEAVAVTLGLTAADRIGLATEAPATASAQAKIQRVLPRPLAERIGAVQETLGFTLRRREGAARPAADVLLAVGTAVRTRRAVDLRYRSWGSGPSRREVQPYGVVFHGGRWYLTGHDDRSREVRTFRLDRIVELTLLSRTFEPPEGFDPVGHVVRSLARVPYAYQVDVLLEADLARVRARVTDAMAELSEVDGGVLMRVRAERLDGMAQMLAGLGFPFTVRSPDELRVAVADYAAALAGYAARTSRA